MADVESREGVENIEGIVETEGIDGVAIGSNDLSQSFGVAGQTNHPLVVEAIDKILAAGKKVRQTDRRGRTRRGDAQAVHRTRATGCLLTSVYSLIIGAGKQFLGNTRG